MGILAATALAMAAPATAMNFGPQGLTTRDLATGGETPTSLVRKLLGPDAVIRNVVYRGAPIAAGTFGGGTGILGFEEGILLGTGNIASVVGPTNSSSQTTTENEMPGDADLDAIVVEATLDAAVLEFDLDCTSARQLSFEYVFTSEEYDCPPIDDVFACFVNGSNVARIPVTNAPIKVGSVNCGCPYAPPSGPNCNFYRTNDCDSLGLGFPCANIATEMDGLTVVLAATGMLHPGTNHVKLAIADFVDMQYDSNVFVRGQTFTCADTAPVFTAPSPCGQYLQAWRGVPFEFEIAAEATNGAPAQAVTLSVAGSPEPIAEGTFDPALPAGPAQPVSTRFRWTPTAADFHPIYDLVFTATDQLQSLATCTVHVLVSDAPGTDLCQAGTATVIPCPCDNPPLHAPAGCDNTAATGGARLYSTGEAVLTRDSLVLSTVGEPPTALSIVLQGKSVVPDGAVYGHGVRCVGGPFKRLYVKSAVDGSITAPQSGDSSVSVRSAALGDPIINAQFRYYAVYYRDPGTLGNCSPSATFNITQTQKIQWPGN